MRASRLAILVALLLGSLPAAVRPQVEAGRFQLTPYGGFFRPDESAALKDAGLVGIEAVYYLNGTIAVGLTGEYVRGQSDGSYFPAMRWDVGPDTSRLFYVGQDLTILTYGAVAKLGLGTGRLVPYAAAGVGGYTFFLDPQANDRPARMSGLALQAGAGLHLRLSPQAGVRIDARDIVFTDYDRDRLYPVNPRFQTDVFAVSNPPPEKSTIHNLRVAIGFSYLPSR